jgi:hypothetical protein
LLIGVGDAILDQILNAIGGALLQGIINDHNPWCVSPLSTKKTLINFQQPSEAIWDP